MIQESVHVYAEVLAVVAVDTSVAEGGKDPGVEAGSLTAVSSRGSFFLGLFKSASESPFKPTFVIPMTGGSPFFTNSYNPTSR